MAAKHKDLEYYLAQARRITEHREARPKRKSASCTSPCSRLPAITFAFWKRLEQWLNLATPRMAKQLRKLVEDTEKIIIITNLQPHSKLLL